MRIPWPALLESPASSTAAPQLPWRMPGRTTSFGRELAAALKQGASVESDQSEHGTGLEGAAIAIAMPLPDPATALSGTRHDLHPPQVIERDVLVRVVAGRGSAKTRLPLSTLTPPSVAGSFQGEANGSTRFGVISKDSAPRAFAEETQPQAARPSHSPVIPDPSTASRAHSPVPPLVADDVVVSSAIEARHADSHDGANRQQPYTPHERPLGDDGDQAPRPPGQIAPLRAAAATVHVGTHAGLEITRPQPVAENAANNAANNAEPPPAPVIATRLPAAAQSAPLPAGIDAGSAPSQTVIDPAAQRSITGELPESDTTYGSSADSLAGRDPKHAVGVAHQKKPPPVARALEPAERWPAAREGAADVPAAANEKIVKQALDAAAEIAIDGLALRKVMQPQRWSMLLEPKLPLAGHAPVDSGTPQEPAGDSTPQGQDHAASPAAREAAAPAARSGTAGGFQAAVQPPAAESVSSASVSPAVVAAHATQPAASPAAAAPLRLDAAPAPLPALIEQVVHRLLDAPANGTVALRLDPPELGTLIIRFQRRGSQLSITLTAEREDVSRLLRQGLGPLQSSLTQLHEQVSVQVDTHDGSRGRGEETALGARRQREQDSHQNEPAHDQDNASPRETPAQRAKRAMRHARLDVWS